MAANPSDPFEFFQLSKEMIAAQQRFLPSSKLLEQITETMRNLAQAQIAYGQALMRANAALLGAWMERPAEILKAETLKEEQRPGAAPRQSEYSAQ